MGPVPSAHGALRRRPARDDVGGGDPLSPTSSRRRSRAKRANGTRPGPSPLLRLRLDAHARDSPGLCMGPCLRPTARCAVGLHGMTMGRRAALRQRHPGAASARQGARRNRPGPSPLLRLRLDAHARDSPALCMGPVPPAHGAPRRRPARDDVEGGELVSATGEKRPTTASAKTINAPPSAARRWRHSSGSRRRHP